MYWNKMLRAAHTCEVTSANYVIQLPLRVHRGSYGGILVMRDYLILFSVKREIRKLFFVIRDPKVLRDA